MSDNASDDQLTPMQAESDEVNNAHESDDEPESQFEDLNTSMGPVNNEFAGDELVDNEFATDELMTDEAHSAALVILSNGGESDESFQSQVLGIEGFRKVTSGHEEHENVRESGTQSIQNDDVTMLDQPDVDIETSHEPADHDHVMEHEHDEQGNTSTARDFVQEDVDAELSLFIPERSSSHSPAAFPGPPCLSTASPHQTPTPTRQSQASSRSSVFAKVRNMQKRVRERKSAFNNPTTTFHSSADLDPETYLEAVTSGLRPPVGAYPVEVDEDEMAHRKALAEFAEQKRRIQRIKEEHNGRLPFRYDVEWSRAKGAEDARLRKRQRDRATVDEDGEQDVFPLANTQTDERDEESDDADEHRPRRRGQQPRKPVKPISMQDAEMRSMLVAVEADEDRPKKKKKGDPPQGPRPAKSRASKSKPRPSQAKGAGKSTAKGSRKTAKDKRNLEQATKQATSLFNSDVFEQQAGMSGANQPTFTNRNKAEALKELIASVPIQDKKQVRNDMNILLQASKDFDGVGACKIASSSNWSVRGMKTTLKGYQVLGTAFMRRRENEVNEPRGGLMADQMGLGKTLMMLANIVNSRDGMIKRKESGPRTTLLVAGPALLTQWAAEIEQHTSMGLQVMRYGAGTRIDSTNAMQVLGTHDIILTTYSEIMKSYPKNEAPVECQTAEQKIEWWKEVWGQQRGVLHQMHFKRIVLDEAQSIKNHRSRTSIACRALMADHKWALSGTPILNGLEELYPYFKFLNVPHTGSFKIFKNNYCGAIEGENAERLLVRLSQFMIRRTHADTMFNAPILKLPQANQSTYWCEFNSVERCIYIIVHQRFAANINMWSKKGTLHKSYSNVLVMLLRLRQLTGHILMLQFVMRDLLEREDIERIKDVVKTQASSNNSEPDRSILAIRKQLDAHELREKKKAAAKKARRLAAEEAAKAAAVEYVEPDDDADVEEDDAPVEVPVDGEAFDEEAATRRYAERNKSGKGFGKGFDFKPYMNSLATGQVWEQKKENAKCAECGERPFRPWKTICGHLLCETCYEMIMSNAAEEGRSNGTCKACGQTFHHCEPCEEVEEDLGPMPGTRAKAAQKKKQEKERLEREDIADDWLSLGGDDVLPSAKTLAVKAQILNWVRENPNVKIIVYTQFLAMIRILAKICLREGWRTEQYHGKLSLQARDKSIKEFATNPSSRVLLASLRCGGLGLNLTMASKVIMIDPWWNAASEQQAFCRVFRIGQEDETFMTRMCVKNTVDERLIEMQTTKQKEIDGVMDDRGRKTKNLNISDLMRLFGNIEEDSDGKPFILVENPAAAGGFFADGDHEGYADEL